jgi:Kef-type K+ transport system membrane component KefB
MNFQTLTIVMLAGVYGPLLASGKRRGLPVIVGELAAGALLGTAGLHVLNPAESTLAFLANAGFVMLMFAAGMHVPVRSLARCALPALTGAIVCTALGVAFGMAIHLLLGGPGLLYALLMANSSAAVILPLVQEQKLDQDKLATTLALVTVADVLTIVTLPLVLAPSKLGRSAFGALAVIAALALLVALALALRGRAWVNRLRSQSRKRGWALELRVSLVVTFALAAVAQRAGISLMIAGFAGGLLLAWLGGPKRLDKQVAAVAQGFFVPVFFVALGAKLNVGQVFTDPSLLTLALALCAGAGAVHLLCGLVMRRGAVEGLLASAQLGLPAAAADLGLKAHAISPGQAAAIVLGGLGAIALSVLAAARLAAAQRATEPDPLLIALVEQLRDPSSWRSDVGRRELAGAEGFLRTVLSPEHVEEAMRQFTNAQQLRHWKAKDILKASKLDPLPAHSARAPKKLERLSRGKKLAPVLLVHREGQPTIVADGYHRACTSYLAGPRTCVPALEARL